MSDTHDQAYKVISIKKITEFNQQDQHDDEIVNTSKINSAQELAKIKREIHDLTKQKEILLKDIKVSIEHEKESWLIEKEAERKAAQESGYESGYMDGTNQAKQEWNGKLDTINELTDKAKEDYFRTIDKHEEAIIQLAIASAEKIINNKLTEDKDYFIGIIEEAITELKDFSYIHIYVHPNEYEHVLNQKAELEQIVDANDLISIYADAKLNEGDCMIKHPNGQIDASIDLQLREIKEKLSEKIMEQS